MNKETIEVIVNGKEEVLTEDNFSKGLTRIGRRLRIGTPVMIETSHIRNLSSWSTHQLFISDGDLNEEGVFGIKKEKKGFPSASVSEEDSDSYTVERMSKLELVKPRLKFISGGSNNYTHENTFGSPRYETRTDFQYEGVKRVVIGEELEDKFSDAINAMRFVGNAFYFELGSLYAIQNYMIALKGDKREIEEQREKLTSRIARVRSTANLLKEARREIDIKFRGNGLNTIEIGFFLDETDHFRTKGHPVNEDDFLVREFPFPYRDFAFLKVDHLGTYTGVYVLPIRRDMIRTIELAFSEKMVAKYYPSRF